MENVILMNARPTGAGARRSLCPSRERPIDLVHLARQTMGDRALEQEILLLMERQITLFRERLPNASPEVRGQIAHAMAGAARNLGAFPLATAASLLENEPENAWLEEAFDAELNRTLQFIHAIGAEEGRRGAAG